MTPRVLHQVVSDPDSSNVGHLLAGVLADAFLVVTGNALFIASVSTWVLKLRCLPQDRSLFCSCHNASQACRACGPLQARGRGRRNCNAPRQRSKRQRAHHHINLNAHVHHIARDIRASSQPFSSLCQSTTDDITQVDTDIDTDAYTQRHRDTQRPIHMIRVAHLAFSISWFTQWLLESSSVRSVFKRRRQSESSWSGTNRATFICVAFTW